MPNLIFLLLKTFKIIISQRDSAGFLSINYWKDLHSLARLQPHLLCSSNYCTLQFAYRPLHSTETALLKVTDDIYRSIDNGSFTVLVSLDISAAFDAMDHSVLSSRLQSDFSIDGMALDWIQSYLGGRHSFVQVGRSTSCQQPCIAGIPVGSVLGPLLYTAYISPIGRVVGGLGVKHHEYADDTQLYVEMTDRGSLDWLSRFISCLQHWFMHAQSPATQWKQVRRHHHWDSSTSRSGAAADTFACR